MLIIITNYLENEISLKFYATVFSLVRKTFSNKKLKFSNFAAYNVFRKCPPVLVLKFQTKIYLMKSPTFVYFLFERASRFWPARRVYKWCLLTLFLFHRKFNCQSRSRNSSKLVLIYLNEVTSSESDQRPRVVVADQQVKTHDLI